MSQILSPDEVDALLEAFETGGPDARREPAASGVRPVDLTRRDDSSSVGNLPGFHLVLGRFARGLRGSLGTLLGQVPSVAVESTELVALERAFCALDAPLGFVRFRLAPLRGHGLLALPASLVATVLEAVCGGTTARPTPAPVREFSAVEQRLIERVALRVLAELRDAWAPVAALECSYVRTETSPLFAAVAAPEDHVVQVVVTIGLEGLGVRKFALAIPNAALDPIRAGLQTPRARDDGGATADPVWTADLRERLATVPVEVAVELGTRPLALSRLFELKVGDLLTLDTGREGPVLVRVAGRPHFRGAPGVVAGNNALRVTERF